MASSEESEIEDVTQDALDEYLYWPQRESSNQAPWPRSVPVIRKQQSIRGWIQDLLPVLEDIKLSTEQKTDLPTFPLDAESI